MYSLREALYSLLSENREAQAKKQFVSTGKLDEDEFKKIYDADPSPAKKYVLWLMDKYYKEIKEPYLPKKGDAGPKELDPEKKGRVMLPPEAREKKRLFFEDLPAVTEALDLFIRVGHKFPHTDIQSYKTIEDFRITAAELREKLSPEELESGKAAATKYPELIIGKVDGYTVYKFPQKRPDLKNIAIDLGSGYGWCTARTDDSNQYERYNNNDAIYIFIKGNERYQHDQYSKQWMGKHNTPMKDLDLKAKFQKFLGDVEGRIYNADQLKDLDKYKIADYDSQGKKYPMYKIGNKYYTIVKNDRGKEEAIYYDPDVKRFKDSDSKPKGYDILFKHPYLDYLKAVYGILKKENNVKTFNNVIRLLLDLDVPAKKSPDDWWKIGKEGEPVDLSGSDLTSLPEDLWIQGDLDIKGSKITNLPKRIRIDGELIK